MCYNGRQTQNKNKALRPRVVFRLQDLLLNGNNTYLVQSNVNLHFSVELLSDVRSQGSAVCLLY